MRSGGREQEERWVLWLSLGTLLHSAAASIVLPNAVNFTTYSIDKTYAKLEWDGGGTCRDVNATIITFGELSPESLEGLAWLGLDSAFPLAQVLNHRNGVLSQYGSLQEAIGQQVKDGGKEKRDCICQALHKAMELDGDIIFITHHEDDPCDEFDVKACRTKELRKKIFVSGPEVFMTKVGSLFTNHTDFARLHRPADIDAYLEHNYWLPNLTAELSEKLGCDLPSPVCGVIFSKDKKDVQLQKTEEGCKRCGGDPKYIKANRNHDENVAELCQKLSQFCLPCDYPSTTTTVSSRNDTVPFNTRKPFATEQHEPRTETQSKENTTMSGQMRTEEGMGIVPYIIVGVVALILHIIAVVIAVTFWRRRQKNAQANSPAVPTPVQKIPNHIGGGADPDPSPPVDESLTPVPPSPTDPPPPPPPPTPSSPSTISAADETQIEKTLLEGLKNEDEDQSVKEAKEKKRKSESPSSEEAPSTKEVARKIALKKSKSSSESETETTEKDT